ncbi:hypothetical protein [Streptosporangium sp. NBC_01756]|uniref:hypothetical protein n=1 Tax=Streptosporangium sp. NBC_01756 TaxID=2975950 RepID=UPI002DDC11FA|nr:hypothetical protein [Streptosporangium sp. NBC_01756]WSC86135.1 hypothetical protein OIE48_38230 [Streptosporangium sp. NBC_01756]
MKGYLDLHVLTVFAATSLVAGAGLAAVYGLGLLGLSIATADAQPGGRRLLGSVLAVVSFLVIVAGVGLGLYVIVT